MKRLFRLYSLGLLLTIFALPQATAAQGVLDPVCVQNPDAAACHDRGQTLQDNGIFGQNGIFNKATSLLALVGGIAAVIVIIVAGLQYVLSAGDSAKVNNAKNMILYAVIGLIVIILARSIISFVIRRL